MRAPPAAGRRWRGRWRRRARRRRGRARGGSGERQQRADHALHLAPLRREPLPQTACLTAWGVYEKHGIPAIPADSSTTPRAWPTAKARAGVAAEVEVLDRERRRLVLADQVAHARVDIGEPALERLARARLDHAAVERGEPRPVREHHAVARVRGAGVDAEDDHQCCDSARDGGRLLGSDP